MNPENQKARLDMWEYFKHGGLPKNGLNANKIANKILVHIIITYGCGLGMLPIP